MNKATKTLNPLHFEDLEPHRFEDLSRQLIYEFRDWSALEATGRSGGDDGYDARGVEKIITASSEDEEEPEVIERIWLIQCKREKSITPKKIASYLDECLRDKDEKISGVVFIAPCNLSKKTRDTFYVKMREYDIEEFVIWGNGELEDQLFQPKNDHLLFAYFNISLKVHHRTRKTQIRSKLATKRKALKVIDSGQTVLIRDPDALSYPDSHEIKNFENNRQWLVYRATGHYYDGIKIQTGRFFAYLDENGKNFDFAWCCNDAFLREDIWRRNRECEIRNEIWEFWDKIPEQSKGWFSVESLIPYDNILAIDEDGDEYVHGPHIYTSFTQEFGPFDDGQYHELSSIGYSGNKITPIEKNRIEYFPKEMRKKFDPS